MTLVGGSAASGLPAGLEVTVTVRRISGLELHAALCAHRVLVRQHRLARASSCQPF